MNVYDWDTNVLDVKDKHGVRYRLELKGRKTIVKGDSATGKTYLCNILRLIKRSQIEGYYNADNIVLLSEENRELLKTFENKLIIVDRAEIVLRKMEVEIVNRDYGKNRYIIFSRVPIGIELSPNYVADMIKEDGVISIKYRFNVRGWN